MRESRTTCLLLSGLLLTAATEALGMHPVPAKARLVKVDLVTAYAPCTNPDTRSGTPGTPGAPTRWPACSAAVRTDPICGFGATGRGTAELRINGSNVGVKLKLKGLSAGCEGQYLGVVFGWQVTTDDCGGAACTLQQITPGYGGGCLVKRGGCVMNFPPTEPPSFLATGVRANIEVTDFYVARGDIKTFRMGVLLP